MNNAVRCERRLAESIADTIVAALERIVETHAVRLVEERLGTNLGLGGPTRYNGARPTGRRLPGSRPGPPKAYGEAERPRRPSRRVPTELSGCTLYSGTAT